MQRMVACQQSALRGERQRDDAQDNLGHPGTIEGADETDVLPGAEGQRLRIASLTVLRRRANGDRRRRARARPRVRGTTGQPWRPP